MSEVPVVDVSPLAQTPSSEPTVAEREVGAAIDRACRDNGFFYVSGHGVPQALRDALHRHAAAFFARDADVKARIAMAKGGRAWRGWFPVGAELTSGRPDVKEGLYFGRELPLDDPRVLAETPLHGPNLFPDDMPELRRLVLGYIDELTSLGHAVMRGVALGLGVAPDHFRSTWMADPLVLFRIFHYPPMSDEEAAARQWGVGEHTDYGVLTILGQDDVGGLQVKSGGRWVDAPPLPGTFVCNIGDMLERLTGGVYRSTPHRVLNTTGRDRYSFPFFFDPGFDATVTALPLDRAGGSRTGPGDRWDGTDVHAFEGTYGDYLLAKVSKVFPELGRTAL